MCCLLATFIANIDLNDNDIMLCACGMCRCKLVYDNSFGSFEKHVLTNVRHCEWSGLEDWEFLSSSVIDIPHDQRWVESHHRS